MKNKNKQIKAEIKKNPERECRNCGYLISSEEFFYAAFDYDCPRCSTKLSQFRAANKFSKK